MFKANILFNNVHTAQACIQLYSDPSYFYQQWLNDMVAMVSVAHELDAFEITMTIDRLFFVFLFS